MTFLDVNNLSSAFPLSFCAINIYLLETYLSPTSWDVVFIISLNACVEKHIIHLKWPSIYTLLFQILCAYVPFFPTQSLLATIWAIPYENILPSLPHHLRTPQRKSIPISSLKAFYGRHTKDVESVTQIIYRQNPKFHFFCGGLGLVTPLQLTL